MFFVGECPTGPDPLKGLGGESGRDCSGRGICDYKVGLCTCFLGFYGQACEYQVGENLQCFLFKIHNSLFYFSILFRQFYFRL